MADAKSAVSARAPRTGRLARTAMAGLASARVGALTVRHRWQADASDQAALEIEIGRVLLGVMSQMRGTALKAAQLLSMESCFLPEGVKAQLARASHQAVPLNRALIGKVFRQAFGREPEEIYQHFEPTAFAAASLGQVHRARLQDGRWVAVKIQYPGMSATIETDIALLRTALRHVGKGLLKLPNPEVVESTLAEIRRQLLEEVDYTLEAERQQHFAAALQDTRLVVADVVASHTRPTVLTQTLLVGQHLADFRASQPAPALVDAQGQALFDWLVRSAFVQGRIQADLHVGNVLFLDDGRVGLLDFGCTRELSPIFAQALAKSWVCHLDEPAPARGLFSAYKTLGLITPSLSLAQFEAQVLPAITPLLAWATEPLIQTRFNYASKSAVPLPRPESQAAVFSHVNAIPPEMISFDRAWLGLTHLLQGLGARVDTCSAVDILRRAAQDLGPEESPS